MKRRILTILILGILAVVCAIGLTACGGDKTTGGNAPQQQQEQGQEQEQGQQQQGQGQEQEQGQQQQGQGQEQAKKTILFDYNGAKNTSGYLTTKEVNGIDKNDFVFGLTKDNYNFRGLEYNGQLIFDEYGNKVNDVTLVNNMTFKARFSDKAKLTIVSNMPEAGTYGGGKECDFYTYCDIYARPNKGYNFLGWYQIDNQTLSYDMLVATEQDYKFLMWTEDVTIQAKFEIASFDLYIYSNNTDLGQVFDTASTVKIAQDESTLSHKYLSTATISAITKTDTYRFLGWYDTDNNLVSPNAVYTFTMVNYDYTLEAKWNRFNIEYDLKGGTQNPSNPTKYSVEDTKSLYTPTKTGYTFNGWEYEGDIITEINGSIAKHVKLTATWSPNKYSLTINYYKFGTTTPIATQYTAQVDFDSTYSVDSPIIEDYFPDRSIVVGEMDSISGKTESVFYSDIPIFTVSGSVITGLTDYGKTLTSISIPEYIDDVKITSIGSDAFSHCSSLTNITIGSSVTSIGDWAFAYCSSLTSITIGSSVTSIGGKAFLDCTSLESVTIGSSVTSIGSCAFYDCDSLTSITIGSSVTSIEYYAFSGCSKLSALNYDGTISQWESISKGDCWKSGVPATKVHCTDGDVSI